MHLCYSESEEFRSSPSLQASSCNVHQECGAFWVWSGASTQSLFWIWFAVAFAVGVFCVVCFFFFFVCFFDIFFWFFFYYIFLFYFEAWFSEVFVHVIDNVPIDPTDKGATDRSTFIHIFKVVLILWFVICFTVTHVLNWDIQARQYVGIKQLDDV